MKTINNDDEEDSGRLQRIRIIPIIATCRVTDIKDHQEQRIKVKRNKRKVKSGRKKAERVPKSLSFLEVIER